MTNQLNALETQIWTEYYRPHTVAETILPDRIKSVLQGYVDNKTIKNYTAVGSPGCGKTSSAIAMLEEMDVPYLKINASEIGNIETIRTTVREYASKMTLSDYDYKVIILDEADGLTITAQNALRGVIEEFQETTRFILTANSVNKISEAIKSRCPVVEFTFSSKSEKMQMLKEFFNRIEEILKQNNVHYDRAELIKFCNSYFPDFRRTLNLLSRNIINNVLELKNVGSANDDKIEEIISLIRGANWTEMRKWVAESNDTDPSIIRRALYDKMSKLLTLSGEMCFIMILNEYDFKEASVKDPEINMVAMFTQMIQSVAEGDLEFK